MRGDDDMIARLRDDLRTLQHRVSDLETEVRELRALVTPLDPGSLPNGGDPR